MLFNKVSIVLFLILCGIISTYAQGGSDIFTDLEKRGTNGGEVKIYQEEEINQLIREHIIYNEKLEGFPGYRIRIFSKTGNYAKDEMRRAKSIFLKMYPDIRAYEAYDHVNFKLYIGDFRTKSEALKILHAIKGTFPSAFIVNAPIDYPKPQQKKDFHD